jgi:serine/threonine-protein kinase
MPPSPAPRPTDTDRNLLLGVHALRAGLIDSGQFARACTAWLSRPDSSLAELLVEHGWLTPSARADLEGRLSQASAAEPQPSTVDQEGTPLPLGPGTSSLLGATGHYGEPGSDDGAAPSSPGSRGRFTVLRVHAKGGLGQVSLARDLALRRDVALKEIRPDRLAEPSFRQRFLNEAEITGQLEHPGIVPVYALDHDADGLPYYAMRFIQGQTLADAIAAYHLRPSPLAFRDLLRRFIAVCQTLAYAHSKGVIHRDLKPANVMLGDYGETLVVDWGLAKRVGSAEAGPAPADAGASAADEGALTRAGQVMGTPAYMAPEQAHGESAQAGPPADVYALGAILYHILTGAAPYQDGPKGADVLARVRRGPPPPPSQVRPGLPRALEAVCLKAMARAPADRYPGAADLGQDVERWLADEPVAVYRDPPATRLTRWGRRNRGLASGLTVLLLTAVVALTANAILLGRANAQTRRERDKARDRLRMAMGSVHRFYTQVSESLELKEQGLEDLRRGLLRTAARYYEQFVQEEPDDPEVQAERARAYGRLADIYHETGRNPDARQAYQAALEALQPLTEGQPDLRRDVAEAYNGLGNLYRETGRHAQAQDSYRSALDIRQALVEADPDSALLQQELANTHNSRAVLYRDTRRRGKAEGSWKEALRILEPLAAARPAEDSIQHDLARCRFNLGNLFWEAGRRNDAEKAYQGALAVLEPLVKAHPRVPAYRQGLARAYYNLANLYLTTGPAAKAAPAYRSAFALFDRLAQVHPEVVSYALDSGACCGNLGHADLQRGAPKDALVWFDRALERLRRGLEKEPRHAPGRQYLLNAQSGRATALVQLLRLGEATEQAREAAGDPNAPSDVLYNAACVYALAARASAKDPRRADAYATRAVALLRQTAARGFPQGADLHQDTDLESLRSRADFKKLLGEHKATKPPR